MSRPATRLEEVVAALRERILDGDYAPGSRLPTRLELQDGFAASSITVQRALDRLGADGFVVARGRNGTFVVEHPPHTSRYALAFGHRPRDPGWVGFWSALRHEAAADEWRGARRIDAYVGIDGRSDGEDWQRLLRDVASRRVAGVLVAHAPHDLIATSLLRAGVPLAAVMRPGDVGGAAAVTLDDQSFVDRALDDLAARGCRRIAALLHANRPEPYVEALRAGIERRGMRSDPRWIHGCAGSPEAARWLRGWARLAFDPRQAERPDGLLIADDNLVADATAGLVAIGAGAGQPPTVIAHCNFPHPTPSVFPARRLGFDARRVLRAGIGLLTRARDGAGEARILVPAQFEDEIDA